MAEIKKLAGRRNAGRAYLTQYSNVLKSLIGQDESLIDLYELRSQVARVEDQFSKLKSLQSEYEDALLATFTDEQNAEEVQKGV